MSSVTSAKEFVCYKVKLTTLKVLLDIDTMSTYSTCANVLILHRLMSFNVPKRVASWLIPYLINTVVFLPLVL